MGHESWWNPTRRRTSGLQVDVSWMALPDIEQGRWAGPVVHIIRNPIDVVRSFVGIGFFAGTDVRDRGRMWSGFARRHEPAVNGLQPLSAAVEWWARWNERCGDVADLIVRTEDLGRPDVIAEVGAALGHRLDPVDIDATTNGRRRAVIDEQQVWYQLGDRATQWGYTP